MRRAAFLLAVILAASACDSDAREPDIVKGPSDNESHHMFGDFDTVHELLERSDKVAVVEVLEEEWRGKANGFARVLFSLRTVEAIKGAETGEVFEFTQPDPARQVGIWVPPEVKPGNRYLMFLGAMEENVHHGGRLAGSFASWVGESIYVRVGTEWVRRVEFDQGGATPATISDAEIRDAVAGLENANV